MYTFFELQIKNFSFLLNTQKHLSVSENFKSMIQIWVPQDMGNMISQHSNQAMVWAIQGSVSIKGVRFFSPPKHPDQLWGPPSLIVQWVLGDLSLGIKQAGNEHDYSHPSSADKKNEWSYITSRCVTTKKSAVLPNNLTGQTKKLCPFKICQQAELSNCLL